MISSIIIIVVIIRETPFTHLPLPFSLNPYSSTSGAWKDSKTQRREALEAWQPIFLVVTDAIPQTQVWGAQ